MENFSIDDIIAIARRRWWILATVLIFGLLITVVYVQSLPSIYAANARILVESSVIPGDLARSTVDQSIGQRVALIRQRLFTRQTLLEIAREQDVFPDVDNMSPTDIVSEMQRAAGIRGIGGGRRNNTNITSISISFRSPDPQTAARVANDLVTRVIEQNVQQRTAQALGTLAFFDSERVRLENELSTQSQRIAQFQVENSETLQGMQSTHQQELSRLRERSFELSLERRALQAEMAALSEALEIGVDDESDTAPQSRELRRLRTQLAIQRATFAESHPSIQMLNARISALEEVVRQENTGEEAATRRLARIEEIETRLSRLNEIEENQFERVAQLEGYLAQIPETTIRLDALRRDYGGLQRQYSDVIAKRATAETGERLETTQQAERFEIVEQALPPETPIAPNRQRLTMAGIGASGVLGMGLIVLLELLNRAMRTPRDLERLLDIQPIATIAYIRTARDVRVRRWSIRAAAVMVLLTGILTGLAVDRLVMPLPLMAERVVDRLGL